MSEVILAQDGYTTILDALLSGLNPYAHLFTNDVTPTPATQKADFVEVIMRGYKALPVKRWTPAALRGGLAFSVADALFFSYLSGALPAPVRGYYVTDGADGRLLWSWRRPGDGFQFGPATPVLGIYVTVRFPLVCP